MVKKYKLLDSNGNIYLSDIPGEFGGNSKAKIYGTLDCSAAIQSMKKYPGEYQKHRVFFADEKTALEAGYRPCGRCLRKKYDSIWLMRKPTRRNLEFNILTLPITILK